MEASGCAIRQLPRCSASLRIVGRGYMGLRRGVPARVYVGGGGFSDEGHLRFYAKCGEKTEKKEEKKRAKLAKGLSKDLSALMEGLATSCADGVVQEAASGNKMAINEAASVLLAHLEEASASAKALKKQEKEMKMQEKELMKAQKKASKMEKTKGYGEGSSSSSSSESSESSDSDCENQRQVVDMSRLRMTGSQLTVEVEPASVASGCFPTLPGKSATVLQIPEQKSAPLTECCGDYTNGRIIVAAAVAAGATVVEAPALYVPGTSAASGAMARASSIAISASPQALAAAAMASPVGNRIEVCMGGKCKKSGSLQLMEELQRQVGAEAAVVGCKCMGKCKEGPNVRVCQYTEDGAPPVKGPLCVGVGLEDVGTLVSSYFGDRDLGFMTAAP